MDGGSGHKPVVKVDLREVLASEAVLGPELRQRVSDFAQGEPLCLDAGEVRDARAEIDARLGLLGDIGLVEERFWWFLGMLSAPMRFPGVVRAGLPGSPAGLPLCLLQFLVIPLDGRVGDLCLVPGVGGYALDGGVAAEVEVDAGEPGFDVRPPEDADGEFVFVQCGTCDAAQQGTRMPERCSVVEAVPRAW